ncbi:MAG: hypothetical protein M9894_10380 [Planctomycetes bacterium]|nr:hypothetical protein [Planctomycetota bacterium]
MPEATTGSDPAGALDALLDALDGDGALGARLEAFAARLGDLLGAAVGVEVTLAGASVRAAGAAALAGAARLPAGPGGALLGRRASAGAGGLARTAARLLARELAWERRAARAARAEDVMSAVTHEMNNALTPLLCHGCEPVARESLRIRALLETLRVVRGRARTRELRWFGDVVERARRLLGVSGGGTFPVEAECAPEAARRAVGPEQEQLVPVVLMAGFALRARARAGTALRLRAGVHGDELRLTLDAVVDAPGDLAGALEQPDPGRGPDVRLTREGERLGLELVLSRRPRVVLLEPAGGSPATPGVTRALEAAGFDVASADTSEGAVALAGGPVEPAALLVLPGAPGQALRQGLHRTQPLLASRCHLLDERLVPRGHRPAADEVDLGELLASARGAEA